MSRPLGLWNAGLIRLRRQDAAVQAAEWREYRQRRIGCRGVVRLQREIRLALTAPERQTQDCQQNEPGGQTEAVEREAPTELSPEPQQIALSRERAFPEWADGTRKPVLQTTPRLHREDLPVTQEWEQNGEIVPVQPRKTKLRSREEAQVGRERRIVQGVLPRCRILLRGEPKRTARPRLHAAIALMVRTERQAVPSRHEAHGKP